MVRILLKKERQYDKLFRKIDAETRRGAWGQLGGTRVETDAEYATEAGYVVEFKQLPHFVIEWVKSQKDMAIIAA